MVTQADFFIALILGVTPALAVLWFSLRPFDRPKVEHTLFDDRRVFGSLAVGMIFGVFASALNLLLPRENLGASVLVLAGILLFEEAFKVVYLNRRKYRGRFDTTFYGVPLGVGAASTAVVASAVWTAAGSLYAPESLALFALFSLGLSLVNGASGTLIGFGASRGLTRKPLAQALAVRYGHAAFLFPFLLGAANPWSFLSVLTSLGFALILYAFAYGELLPGTLPEDLRRKIRRERRRARAVKD